MYTVHSNNYTFLIITFPFHAPPPPQVSVRLVSPSDPGVCQSLWTLSTPTGGVCAGEEGGGVCAGEEGGGVCAGEGGGRGSVCR